ncbi:transcriptional regulator [Labilibaculum manganireducens]|uniref:Transcriptional regulator n=1 Tax=Labilibaculum manganireducens TaxID=1940525 RepID=A0A2N3I7H7_9BACT|nr:helix-turn-helix transcriptional regulator [Labilibaculum manganireducens]PKQ66282.1 transcriptional regulator [Labilibaculum manganireducens]
MDLQVQFGKRVKELRLAKGLSQEALALKAEVDRTYMTSVENGKRNVAIQNIGKIIAALDISIQDFFTTDIFEGIDE